MLERMRVGRGARGGTPSNRLGWQIKQLKNYNIKYIVAFGGHWSIISHTTINQKQTPAEGESMERMCEWVVGAGQVQ
jgi:hypothetical protein